MTLIVGESGDVAWSDGPSARRLWRWFGVDSYEGLKRIATLTNVYPVKGARCSSPEHKMALLRLVADADVVFCVGKRAQLEVARVLTRRLYWREGKFIGLPHPSGLNRQLNGMPDSFFMSYINHQLKEVSDGR